MKALRKKRKSRVDRWADACERAATALEELRELQEEFEEWQGNLPENLQGSVLAEKLEAVSDLEVTAAIDMVDEARGLELPLGFGRD